MCHPCAHVGEALCATAKLNFSALLLQNCQTCKGVCVC